MWLEKTLDMIFTLDLPTLESRPVLEHTPRKPGKEVRSAAAGWTAQ